MYKPRPVDASNIELPDEIVQLTEQLAEHNHDLWAHQRIAEGWTYGPERDDTHKTHPDLVPYSDLPESEKEYDRRAAMETLKATLALGYCIELPPKSPPPFPREEVERIIQRLQDPTPLDLAALHEIWRKRSPKQWASTPEIHRVLGERILGVGEPLLAYDVLSEGLKLWPQDVRLRQLLALALARSGATHRANHISCANCMKRSRQIRRPLRRPWASWPAPTRTFGHWQRTLPRRNANYGWLTSFTLRRTS